MQFVQLNFLLAVFCAIAMAASPQRPILITYPADTPQSFIDKAMDTLREAGGVVTHEYSLIKGFAAKASESTIEALKAMGDEFLPLIEDDQIMRVDSVSKND